MHRPTGKMPGMPDYQSSPGVGDEKDTFWLSSQRLRSKDIDTWRDIAHILCKWVDWCQPAWVLVLEDRKWVRLENEQFQQVDRWWVVGKSLQPFVWSSSGWYCHHKLPLGYWSGNLSLGIGNYQHHLVPSISFQGAELEGVIAHRRSALSEGEWVGRPWIESRLTGQRLPGSERRRHWKS